ncbi:unnamed protein product [Symbiodinium natans]|uniref:Uncharacterized protein n=1 Tax=Symbiodinium natans TaxID=878477 RepID=A0A812NIW6_9DINO|nr:unnamed protein product [Symbiodinium natans]
MATSETAGCLRTLVSASRASEAPRPVVKRLTLLVSHTLSAREAGEMEELEELVAPAGEELLRELLAEPAGEPDEEAWPVLARLLARAGKELTGEILARNWPGSPAAWVRALLEAARNTPCPALELLCLARGARGAGSERRLLPEGAVSATELHENAVITGLVLRGLEGPPSDCLEEGALEVIWELLLAASLTAEQTVVSGAAQAWALLQRAADATKLRFLDLALKEAASEGGLWRISSQEEGEALLPLSAHLAALSPLRHLLAALWTDSTRSEALGAPGFLSWALGDEAPNGTLGWGHAAATVVKQSAGVGILEGPALLGALARCRAWIRDSPISGDAAITEQHLVFATALEEAAQAHAACAGPVPKRTEAEKHEKLSSAGPVISEVPEPEGGASVSQSEPSVLEDLDTSLVESIEKLLRWSQARASRADCFAAYTAALWPTVSTAVATADSTAGRLASRMVRLVLETLGGSVSVLVAGPSKAPTAPGVWRLVAALCKTGQWPEANWPAVLQATAKASKWLLTAHEASANPVSDAFIDDACAAAAALLPWVPSALAPSLAPLLSAPDSQLRGAASQRLQAHRWVPGRAELCSEEGKEDSLPECPDKGQDESWPAPRALVSLKALLEADTQPTEASGEAAQGSLPSCGDVAYVVVGAVFGRELTDGAWAVEDALSAVAAWEVSGDSDDSGGESAEPGTLEQGQVLVPQRSLALQRMLKTSSTAGKATAGTSEPLAVSEDLYTDPATPASSVSPFESLDMLTGTAGCLALLGAAASAPRGRARLCCFAGRVGDAFERYRQSPPGEGLLEPSARWHGEGGPDSCRAPGDGAPVGA